MLSLTLNHKPYPERRCALARQVLRVRGFGVWGPGPGFGESGVGFRVLVSGRRVPARSHTICFPILQRPFLNLRRAFWLGRQPSPRRSSSKASKPEPSRYAPKVTRWSSKPKTSGVLCTEIVVLQNRKTVKPSTPNLLGLGLRESNLQK